MLNKSFYSGAFDDLLGLGRWYNASPAAARIFDHGPSFLRHLGFCFILFIERANGLTRILHSRVIAIDQHLSNHSDALALNVTVQKFVVQRLLNHVANRALRIHSGNVYGGLTNSGELNKHALVSFIFDKGVAANGNYS